MALRNESSFKAAGRLSHTQMLHSSSTRTKQFTTVSPLNPKSSISQTWAPQKLIKGLMPKRGSDVRWMQKRWMSDLIFFSWCETVQVLHTPLITKSSDSCVKMVTKGNELTGKDAGTSVIVTLNMLKVDEQINTHKKTHLKNLTWITAQTGESHRRLLTGTSPKIKHEQQDSTKTF